MSYQVLARKWRPQTFSELVGQQHVVDAITNALENDKLHHAYLFTGTRGVGKTTIARIFSKSLNCEQGQSANPCGKCATCVDISDGRYVDLLEIDAASRTKVEDTRELLDNVQYRPTRGKYKVYLIDEVHMLSKHSFNALLKTLEEPPEHVKFLLATTDPQKLPVTVLSRCLQFSLKALTKEQIQGHLQTILEKESIHFELPALTQIARAAQGSIRDSLSLTDQAIAQGNNQVNLATVVSMLGLLNKNHILKLVKYVCERDSEKAFAQLDDICSSSPDYPQVLSQVLGLLHQIALTQVVPEVCKLESDSAKGVYTLAKALSKEQVQILYQIGLNGKRDLPHAPDARTGLEMTVLRMLAFTPAQTIELDVDALISDEHANLPEPSVIEADVSGGLAPSNQGQSNQGQSNQGLNTAETTIEPKDTNDEHQQAPKLVTENVALETDVNAQEEPSIDAATAVDSQPMRSELESQEPTNNTSTQNVSAQDEPVQSDSTQSASVQYPAANHQINLASQNDTAEALESSSKVEDTTEDSQQATQITQQQAPSADEPIPMVDDMFGDAPPAHHFEDEQALDYHAQNSAQLDYADAQQHNAPLFDQPTSTQPTPSEAATAHENNQEAKADDDDSDNTLALIENSKKLRAMRAEQEEASGKKPEQEANTATQDAVKTHYRLGDEFTEFASTAMAKSLPAFLEDGAKLTLAAQVDQWSAFVDSTGLQALTRQLLIHANCSQIANPLVIKIEQEVSHLAEEAILERVQNTLSDLFDENVEVKIEYGSVADTPFQIQTRISDMRQQHAEYVVDTDPAIQELVKAFDASIVKDSIEVR